MTTKNKKGEIILMPKVVHTDNLPKKYAGCSKSNYVKDFPI